MSVSVLLVSSDEEYSRQLSTEREFREFRRWANRFGDYPTLNGFPLRYTGEQYRAKFTFNTDKVDSELEEDGDESLYDLLKELVDIAQKTIDRADVPEVYDHIIYLMIDSATEALKEGLTMAIV